MARRGITWRDVTSGNPASAASLFNASATQGAAARDAFDALGADADQRRDRAATARALEAALETGQIDASDPNADVSLVADILSSEADRELTGVRTQNAGLEGSLLQFDVDNAEAREQRAIESQTLENELTRTRTTAAQNENALTLLGIEDAREARTFRRQVIQGEQAFANWRRNAVEAETQRLMNVEGLTEENARVKASDNVQANLGDLAFDSRLQQEIGVSEAVFGAMNIGQELGQVRKDVAARVAQAAIEAQQLAGKEAGQYRDNVERVLAGESKLLYINPETGKVDVRRSSKPNTLSQGEATNQMNLALRDDASGKAVDLSKVEGFKIARDILGYVDATVAEQVIATAKDRSKGDPEKFVQFISAGVQGFLAQFADFKDRERFMKNLNAGLNPMSSIEEAKLLLRDDSQAPGAGEGYDPLSAIDDGISAANRPSVWSRGLALAYAPK